MKNKIKIIVLLILVACGIGVYCYLAKNNKNVKHWHNLPFSTKQKTLALAIEGLGNRIYAPPFDSTIEASITKEKLTRSVQAGANWIVNMQEEDGRFQYWYDPGTNTFSSKTDDNFLRQAGTSYALMLSYEITKDSAYLTAAKRSLAYLMQFKKDLDNDKSYFMYGGKAKLGGIALPLLTMNKLYEVCNDSTYLNEIPRLVNMILYLQNHYNTGRFKSTYVYLGDYNHEENSGWESDIYPGEALLALALSYKNFKVEEYKSSFDKAYDYYASKRRWKTNDFTSWAISAFAEMFLLTNEDRYAEFLYEMSDFSISWQNLNSKYIEYGSIYPLPSVFTSTTYEGIGDAIKVAEVQGNNEKYMFYKQSSLAACSWLLKLQYSDNQLSKFAKGGFRNSLNDSKIRIDNTQHSISAMIKVLKNVKFVN